MACKKKQYKTESSYVWTDDEVELLLSVTLQYSAIYYGLLLNTPIDFTPDVYYLLNTELMHMLSVKSIDKQQRTCATGAVTSSFLQTSVSHVHTCILIRIFLRSPLFGAFPKTSV